jgi:predicted ATPase
VITRLNVANFKGFTSLELAFRPLTVLTGPNNSGKSSVIQALLLAHLAFEGWSPVPLNGSFGLALGEATDVLNVDAPDARIGISVDATDLQAQVEFDVPVERGLALPIADLVPEGLNVTLIGIYLSAERLGPRDLLEVDPKMQSEAGLDVGYQGQFTPHVLARLDRHQVREPLRHPSTAERGAAITLGTQTELWLGEIVRPIRIRAEWLANTSAATIRFRGEDARTEWLRPANVGFGLSYALPVVVAALIAAPGSVLVVENPEAHLHPAGQSAIGRFLVTLAAAGVQTIIETHSDHVVNGIRLAVAEQHILPAPDAVIHFLGPEGESRIEVSETGALSEWPRGFFDQVEFDLAQLSRISRPR